MDSSTQHRVRVLIVQHDPHVARMLLRVGEDQQHDCATITIADAADGVRVTDPGAILVDTDPADPRYLDTIRSIVAERPEVARRIIILATHALSLAAREWTKQQGITLLYRPFSVHTLSHELRLRAG